MMCSKPFRRGVAEFGCGQCLPCRINHRRNWVTRLMLEHAMHEAALFVTLTYDDGHLPKDGQLVPRDLVLYLKRLRKSIEPRKVRFYAVGEYGDRRGRPHYHLLLFGVLAGQEVADAWSDIGKAAEKVGDGWHKNGYFEQVFQADFGRVHIGTVTQDSIQYCAQYAIDAWTDRGRAVAGARVRPFSRMSRRKGIGFAAVKVVANALNSKSGVREIAKRGDVPASLRIDGKIVPMGRYLRGKVREEVGMVKQKFRRGEEPLNVDLLVRQMELREPGARALREEQRLQTSRRALVLEAIKRSKGGGVL